MLARPRRDAPTPSRSRPCRPKAQPPSNICTETQRKNAPRSAAWQRRLKETVSAMRGCRRQQNRELSTSSQRSGGGRGSGGRARRSELRATPNRGLGARARLWADALSLLCMPRSAYSDPSEASKRPSLRIRKRAEVRPPPDGPEVGFVADLVSLARRRVPDPARLGSSSLFAGLSRSSCVSG